MFYYNILIEYCRPTAHMLISMDTDSYTLGIAGQLLDDIVSSDKRPEQDAVVKNHWFVHERCLGKECIEPHCNKRVPGPMKLEWKGDGGLH